MSALNMSEERTEFENYLQEQTTMLLHKISKKYEKGKREHAQSILNIDVLSEIEGEIIDFYIYIQLLKFQLKPYETSMPSL